MSKIKSQYDVVIIGAGHNGLIAASYLSRAGLSVLMLEKNDHIGGATYSRKIFPGINAYISEYSYLISLLSPKIIKDLGLNFKTSRRKIASLTPQWRNGNLNALLLRNNSAKLTQKSFANFTSPSDYKGYRRLRQLESICAGLFWPTLLSPLPTKKELKSKLKTKDEKLAWEVFVEQPLGNILEKLLKNDALRGLVFTDAKVGVHTYPSDATLLQNKTFIYHIIGNGTGEWRVPNGGMGALTRELKRSALSSAVTIKTQINVSHISPSRPYSFVEFFENGKKYTVNARFILSNVAPIVLSKLINEKFKYDVPNMGSVFKINMLLRKLPHLKIDGITPQEAFTGTFHLHEGYDEMIKSYQLTQKKTIPELPPGEMYCHSLTDPSILSPDLEKKGYVTLTLFGLDMPYTLFIMDHNRIKKEVKSRYLRVINEYLVDPIENCLARDKNDNPCIEIKSPIDLEEEIGIPFGNIFHSQLSWPFVENENQAYTWGVETNFDNIFICGSGARRGGAVSGIPGHNAAMKVLETIGKSVD